MVLEERGHQRRGHNCRKPGHRERKCIKGKEGHCKDKCYEVYVCCVLQELIVTQKIDYRMGKVKVEEIARAKVEVILVAVVNE